MCVGCKWLMFWFLCVDCFNNNVNDLNFIGGMVIFGVVGVGVGVSGVNILVFGLGLRIWGNGCDDCGERDRCYVDRDRDGGRW